MLPCLVVQSTTVGQPAADADLPGFALIIAATIAFGLSLAKANQFKCAFKCLMSKRCANQGGTPAKDENACI